MNNNTNNWFTVEKILPAHHSLDISTDIISKISNAFDDIILKVSFNKVVVCLVMRTFRYIYSQKKAGITSTLLSV
jgi:hypothetical protein